MPKYRVTGPDGATYEVNAPDGASEAQVMAFVRSRASKVKPRVSGRVGETTVQDLVAGRSGVEADADRLNQERERLGNKPGLKDLIVHGATLGLTDEFAGIGNVVRNAITSPFSGKVSFDPRRAYAAGKRSEHLRLDEARKNAGAGGTLAEIAGGFIGANPVAAIRSAPTLFGRVKQGAKAGATMGAASGFGYGEGTEGTAISTVVGGVAGGILGGAIPVAAEVVANRASGLRRMLGRDPELPRRVVGEAIAADANTPVAAGQMMDAARSRGVPAMLADTGENARGLLASVSRKPGASRTIARDAVIARQEGQADRVNSAIARDLGPVSNPHQVADELMEQARTQAAPLYEQAYSQPMASTPRLRALLDRPSTRSALSRAYRIAAEEGRDPRELGFLIDDAGNVTLDPAITMGADEAGNLTMTQSPLRVQQNSTQTMDYVKRGLDDVVEQYRNPTTGRLDLDTEGRAINNTLRAFLGEMDRLNPMYRQARAAYGGPVSGIDAMNEGLGALKKGADDIAARVQNMTPYEQQMYRLGVRRAMSDLVNSKGDYADKINALLGTPKKRQALERLFGGREEFQRFIATLGDERAAGLTYRSVATGSQTAERQAADELTGDTGLAETVVDAGLRGAKDGLWSSLINAFAKLREVDRFGAGEAGERTRESIAALLTETDPAVLRELIEAANRAAILQGERSLASTRRAVRIGQDVGRLVGSGAGSVTHQPVE